MQIKLYLCGFRSDKYQFIFYNYLFMSVYDKYEIVVGLEVHVQLQTESKVFAPDATDFGALSNTQISPITLAYPGTLPYLNKKVVEYAIKLGLATHCNITPINQFARKNYFYPDLPKGFQTSQFSTTICTNGYVRIKTNAEFKNISIHHIHIEEDAGKSIHDLDNNYSMIDLNRAGVPLLEIVSDPDIRSSEEAYQYLTELRKIVMYLEICDGNMEEGSFRCDANISVRIKGQTELGERTEVKNLNSMRNVKRAIEFESKRQIDLLEAQYNITRETRSFDANNGTTFALRSKELAHDYRYMPEPDLPPFLIAPQTITQIQKELPKLPAQLFDEFVHNYGLSEYDANVLLAEQALANYYLELIKYTKNYKAAANWLTVVLKSYLNEHQIHISHLKISPNSISNILKLIDDGKISHSQAAQKLFPALMQKPEHSVIALAQQLNLLIDDNEEQLNTWIDEIIQKNPDKVKEYKNGKKGLLGFFMGELMKISKGKADPSTANKIWMQKMQ